MLFERRFHDGIQDGTITLAFRHWKRQAARPNGRRRLGPTGVVVIDAVDALAERDVTAADATRAGYESRQELIDDLAQYATDETTLYRITFHFEAEPDERLKLAGDGDLSPEEADDIIRRLERMDRASTRGPWTQRVLELIEANPRLLAATLAKRMGRERLAFKADVRKLKALGLTVSHEIGYEVSPRGKAVLERMRSRVQSG